MFYTLNGLLNYSFSLLSLTLAATIEPGLCGEPNADSTALSSRVARLTLSW